MSCLDADELIVVIELLTFVVGRWKKFVSDLLAEDCCSGTQCRSANDACVSSLRKSSKPRTSSRRRL